VTLPTYDHERNEWIPQCPYGDVCSGCDVNGKCSRAPALPDDPNQRSWLGVDPQFPDDVWECPRCHTRKSANFCTYRGDAPPCPTPKCRGMVMKRIDA